MFLCLCGFGFFIGLHPLVDETAKPAGDKAENYAADQIA